MWSVLRRASQVRLQAVLELPGARRNDRHHVCARSGRRSRSKHERRTRRGVWFMWDLQRDLPGREAVAQDGREWLRPPRSDDGADMAVAFTIFKEQRIEVPLAKVYRIRSGRIVAVRISGFPRAPRLDAFASCRPRSPTSGLAVSRRQQHHYSAAGPSEFSEVRENAPRAKAPRSSSLAQRIERVYQKWQISSFTSTRSTLAMVSTALRRLPRIFQGPRPDLTVSEAATLAGLVKSPSALRPDRDMPRARHPAQRRVAGDGRHRRHRSTHMQRRRA